MMTLLEAVSPTTREFLAEAVIALRAEELRLEAEIEHNKTLLRADLPCCDIGSLAGKLSEVKKAIGQLTIGAMRTA